MIDAPVASRRVRILSALVCGTLWAGSLTATHIPPDGLPEIEHVSDKTLHMSGYVVLAVSLGFTLRFRGATARRVAIVLPIVMMLYGAFDELTQPLFGRHASWGDWLADIAGGVTGAVVCDALFRIRGRVASRTRGDDADSD